MKPVKLHSPTANTGKIYLKDDDVFFFDRFCNADVRSSQEAFFCNKKNLTHFLIGRLEVVFKSEYMR